MTQSSSVDVLIVGGGPTGLMLGCQLALYPKVSFRIVDKNPGATTQSRALAVHARSLELFAQLNLAEKALAQGTIADGMKGFFQGHCRWQIDFTRIRTEQHPLLTRYPYLLFLEQSVTENLLESFLNEHHIQVERNTEVIDFQSIDGNGVEVKLSTGQTIRTKYVCACDGARSIVRHKLNLAFDGRTYSESLFVADCQLQNSPIKKNEAAAFCESTGLIAIFPITNGRYRLIGTIHNENQKDVSIDFNEVIDMVKTRTRHLDIIPHDCNWISIYHSHHRHITDFRYDQHYFLLGDAAHIHSPVGGQGMNTGLQDAHNLAWKLAYVLTYSAHDRLLDTYHNERSQVARTLVRTTDRTFSFISSTHWFTRFVRLYITPYILKFLVQPMLNYSYTFRQMIFRQLSQIGISYRQVNVYDYGASAGSFHRHTPQPGDRFPLMIFNSSHYHLVLFENPSSPKVNHFLQFLQQHYREMIEIHQDAKQNDSIQYEGAFLIRPDGFIAYRTTVFDTHHFQCYMSQFFP